MIGYCICGSFCTHKKSLEVLARLCDEHEVVPILSENTASMDTRFGKASELIKSVEYITGNSAVTAIQDAEPFGPKCPLDVAVISPCTGNTLAKIANGIIDTTVTMAVKAHLRSDRPLVIALASNDALSANLQNIAKLLLRKNVFFVPMFQDDPKRKPHSLVADLDLVTKACDAAQKGVQLRPLFK